MKFIGPRAAFPADARGAANTELPGEEPPRKKPPRKERARKRVFRGPTRAARPGRQATHAARPAPAARPRRPGLDDPACTGLASPAAPARHGGESPPTADAARVSAARSRPHVK